MISSSWRRQVGIRVLALANREATNSPFYFDLGQLKDTSKYQVSSMEEGETNKYAGHRGGGHKECEQNWKA